MVRLKKRVGHGAHRNGHLRMLRKRLIVLRVPASYQPEFIRIGICLSAPTLLPKEFVSGKRRRPGIGNLKAASRFIGIVQARCSRRRITSLGTRQHAYGLSGMTTLATHARFQRTQHRNQLFCLSF